MEIQIIFEDENIVVINKPPDLVCNRAETVKVDTLQDWMDSRYKFSSNENNEEFINRSGLIHRLDKDTSGVMVLAKNKDAFEKVKNQFKERKTKKKYLSLVHDRLVPGNGSINLPIKRNSLNRHKFRVDVDGKMARSEYQKKEEYKYNGLVYSLVSIKLYTGRTHQIRVHLSHLGHPVVSDPLYLGKRLDDDLQWCKRQFLHAEYLSFRHPCSDEIVEFNVDLPSDLARSLEYLSKGL
jgi:23S rRNA pseudouridine1911/1915/1917 synthase